MISWPDAADNFNLFIFKGGRQVASSSKTNTTSETARILNAEGTYEVRVTPAAVTSSGYNGIATVGQVNPFNGGTAPGGPDAFHGTVISGPNPDTEPQNVSTPYSGPLLLFKTTDVGREAAEPTIGIDRQGRAFYAAATFDSVIGQARTVLLRSTDQNTSWQPVQPRVLGVGTHPQTLDPYVFVDPDTDRVFFDDLLLIGGSELSTSDDGGNSFTTSFAATEVFNDHQTITTGKVPAGFTPPVPMTYPKITYQCVNQVTNVACSRSFDGGLTFSPTPGVPFPTHNVAPEGDLLCSSLTGHAATDPEGRLFLGSAFNDCGPPRLAISDNAGNTFRESVISDNVGAAEHEVYTASDLAGNIYTTWWDDKHLLPYLAISTDHGTTWGDPIMIAPPGVKEVNFPSIDAGENGRVAISFPGTTVNEPNNEARPWNYYVVVTTDALSANPTFVSNIANPANDPIHRGDCRGRCDGMLDFLDVTVEPIPANGGPVWAVAVDTCTAQNGCNVQAPAPGGMAGSETDMRGLAIRQTCGPALLGDQPFIPGCSALGNDPVIPETPYAGLLPIAAVVAFAAAVVLRRRRTVPVACGLRPASGSA